MTHCKQFRCPTTLWQVFRENISLALFTIITIFMRFLMNVNKNIYVPYAFSRSASWPESVVRTPAAKRFWRSLWRHRRSACKRRPLQQITATSALCEITLFSEHAGQRQFAHVQPLLASSRSVAKKSVCCCPRCFVHCLFIWLARSYG